MLRNAPWPPSAFSLQPTASSLQPSAFSLQPAWSQRRLEPRLPNGQSAGLLRVVSRNLERMIQAKFLTRILPIGLCLGLAACGGADRICEDSQQPYLSARNNPPLTIPEGMTSPDRSSALPIPSENQISTERRSGGCLADPPSYFQSSGTVARSPEEVIASWAQAWANREAEGVMALYSAKFVAPTDSAGSAAWLEQRREQVAVGPVPASRVEELSIEPDGPDRRIATFKQRFGTNVVQRELVLIREAGSWRIVEEKVVEVR